LVDFVEFIDEEHTRVIFVAQGSKQRPLGKEVERMQPLPNLTPILVEIFALGFKEQLLQGFVELSYSFVFRDSHVALEPFHHNTRGLGDGVCKFGFAAPRWSLDQEWLLHPSSEINHRECHRVDDVSCGTQLLCEFTCGREHVGYLPGVNTTPEAVLLHLPACPLCTQGPFLLLGQL